LEAASVALELILKHRLQALLLGEVYEKEV